MLEGLNASIVDLLGKHSKMVKFMRDTGSMRKSQRAQELVFAAPSLIQSRAHRNSLASCLGMLCLIDFILPLTSILLPKCSVNPHFAL